MVAIKAVYSIRDGEVTEQKYFEASQEARIGLEEGKVAQKLPLGSVEYSGMHDHGPLLPPPREGGVMAQLLQCVLDARKANDEFLTEIIENEKEELPHKKAKTKGVTP